MGLIKYGDTVMIRDNTRLDGLSGLVIKVCQNNFTAQILLDREVIWHVKLEDLEPVL